MSGELIDWWRRRRLTRPRVDRIRRYARQADVPTEIPRHELAVVGDPARPKWLVFECPCGEGHRLQVNLDAAGAASWRLDDHDGGVSIHPSIDYCGSERRCHFWLRCGRVHWV
ncbi:MAG: DUF6527 family protein [Solirubrobacterales bacterium]